MDARGLAIREHDPSLEQPFHSLLGRETPVFLWIGVIQAKTQGA